jgi:DNA-binding NtrC family response regulator
MTLGLFSKTGATRKHFCVELVAPVSNAKPLVLVIEDDAAAAESLLLILRDWGAEVAHGQNGEAVLADLGHRLGEVRWIITDFHLGSGADGVTLVKHLRTLAPDARVLVLSGSFSGRATLDAAKAGFEVMHKPARAKAIIDWLERA